MLTPTKWDGPGLEDGDLLHLDFPGLCDNSPSVAHTHADSSDPFKTSIVLGRSIGPNPRAASVELSGLLIWGGHHPNISSASCFTLLASFFQGPKLFQGLSAHREFGVRRTRGLSTDRTADGHVPFGVSFGHVWTICSVN